MSDKTIPDITEVIAVTDPGEKGREHHVWGDRLVISCGNVMAWLFIVLIFAIVSQIFLRSAGHNQAWLDDLQWWLYGLAVLTGFAYATTTESHVRVDIFYDTFSESKRAKIDIFALAWLLLPFILIMTDILFHYAVSSWAAREGSDSPNGLHGLYLLKTALPILFVLAAIACWAAYYRNLRKLTNPTLDKQLLFAFPATWFIAERTVFYCLWWFTRLTQPDLNPRRISRESIFDYSAWISLVILLSIILLAYFRSRTTQKTNGA
ncbi:MAG: TRAP transporter small permease subunit [Stappiaceae bacterium]